MPPNVENAGPEAFALEESKKVAKTPMEMVQLLVERGITEVPAKFIQPEDKRVGPVTDLQVPVIDMSGLVGDNKDQIMTEIANACEEWGFFQVINHGVPPALMADLLKLAEEFFALSPEEKEVNAIKPGGMVGYGRLFETSKSIANWIDRVVMWSYGEAQKLSEPCKPPKPERFSDVIDAYGRAVFKLCIRILEVLSVTLGLEPHVLGERVDAKNMGIRTSFNYYPPCPQPELVLGLIPHADTGVVTVLQQCGRVSGLEIYKNEQWVQVPPLKDALVVNVADQLQLLSNGKYKSVMHRARTNAAVGRYSFPSFFVPRKDMVIQPLQEILSESNPLSTDP